MDQRAIQVTGIKGKDNPTDPFTKLLQLGDGRRKSPLVRNDPMGLAEQHVLGACKDMAYKGLKTRGHTGEGSPLGDVDIRIRNSRARSGESVGSTPHMVMNQGQGSKTAGCNRA